jgi:SLT domain-containing protein
MRIASAAFAAIEIGNAVAIGAAWTWVEAVKTLGLVGLLVGAALAAAFIAGAVGSAQSGKSAGASVGAAASGGIFSTPGLTAIAEGGKPEIVLNEGNIRKYFPSLSRGGNQTIVVQLDRKPILRATARGMPEYLELHGAT